MDTPHIAPTPRADDPVVSVVMPCLNEADTLATCIGKAKRALAESGLAGEIIVADNGSTDGSPEIAAGLGARVIRVTARGYGNALMAGIDAARGTFVVMGDADDSYDFGEVPALVTKLEEGYDLVQGCRLPAGGGRVSPGAMPFLHRWLGNPAFSRIARLWFNVPVNDVYCGLRGFRKAFYVTLGQRCTGMEFAIEMVLKSSLYGGRIAEHPITLHPDGRKSHAPHLRTFRDGWRTLRFFLMNSPRWLFLIPGILFILAGLVGYGVALPGLTLAGLTFDAHTLLFASMSILCGYQAVLFAIIAKTFAINEGLLPGDRRMDRFYEIVDLERGLLLGIVGMLVGLGLLVVAVIMWRDTGFGRLDYSRAMRWVIPGATLTTLGFQTVLSSFLVSILSLGRK